MPSSENTVHIAIELSTSIWLVGTRLPGTAKSRMHRIAAGNSAALLSLVSDLRARPAKGSDQPPDLACCFEAGRDGFWLQRLLTANGVPTYVVEPTSIPVNRRARRAKTDRLDAEGLLRVLAAYVGLTPTPYQSGTMDRDRRIARAGSPRARTTMVQLAWLWLRYQPESALAAWFRTRVGALQGRTRRIAIVAMARKLLIALWRYAETGQVPDGVAIRATA